MNQKANELTSLDIRALNDLMGRQLKSAKVLSLDCFDTLLWRTVSDPIEVFKDLQNQPLYRSHGINAESRRLAERKVRQLKSGLEGLDEITIEEIYQHMLPNADWDLVEQFVRLEIETEKKYLFAYEPMFALLANAKKMGLTTVLVSDMYIRSHHLKDLVETAAAKAGVTPHIDHYFTSADHRTTKGKALFQVVARQIGVATQAMVHAGDNTHADLEGARRCGVRGYHFDRFSPALEDCMRKNAQLQRLLIDDHGESEPVAMSWHAIWSQLPRTNNTLEMLGWYYLGPTMLHFAHWLVEEVRALKHTGHRPRLVFMMRDGYLSYQTHQTLQNLELAPRDVPFVKMDVSRFATFAINFTDATHVRRYLVANKGKIFRIEMLRQLLGNHDVAATGGIVTTDESVPWETFCSQVLAPEVLHTITATSRRNREQFLSYVRQHVRPQPGETLVLADLGYAGTIQDQIREMLTEAFEVAVEGRYLILREADSQQQHKSGLIDYRQLNRNSINLLLSQIQTLEQLTVNDMGSLIMYDDRGQPVHEAPLLTERQRKLKQLVQTAAMDFVRTQAATFFQFAKSLPPSTHELIGLIARFTLQPRASEIELYREFSHDINNGTRRMRWISNPAMSRQLLIRGGGISYDCDHDKMLANDLNVFGPHLSYFNFVKARLGLKFGMLDHRVMDGDIPCVISKAEQFRESAMPCFHTHDGFKIGLLRDLAGSSAAGISFGLKHSWIQIHSISLVNWVQFASSPNWQPVADLLPTTRIEGGRTYEEGLVHFQQSDGFCYIDFNNLPEPVQSEDVVIVVFREIAQRAPAATESKAGVTTRDQINGVVGL